MSNPVRPRPHKISPPRNEVAKRAYNLKYGELLALEKVWEVKAANYGLLTKVDRNSTLSKLPSRTGYTNTKRKDMYTKALSLYENNELVRPIINLISTAIFSKGQPDFKGSNKELSTLARSICDKNDINFHEIAKEGELAGDVFLWFEKVDAEKVSIWSLDAGETSSVLKNDDLRKLQGYAYLTGGNVATKVDFPVNRVQHFRLNSTTTSQYGRSTLRHIVYWIDVIDKLFEENWLSGAQYYGNPLLVISGVPGPYQATVKSTIEAELHRAGKSWVLPPETEVTTPSLSLDYPIGDIVGWVFRLITIASEIPITLLGSADASSRGSAFFANPRFDLAIRSRREVWRIGLRRFFIKIFTEMGKLKDGQEPTRSEFDIGFLPIFEKDLTDVADIIAIMRDRGAISKGTAAEMVGLDASEEMERMKAEETEWPDKEVNQVDSDGNPLKLASDPVAKARRDAKKKKKDDAEE